MLHLPSKRPIWNDFMDVHFFLLKMRRSRWEHKCRVAFPFRLLTGPTNLKLFSRQTQLLKWGYTLCHSSVLFIFFNYPLWSFSKMTPTLHQSSCAPGGKGRLLRTSRRFHAHRPLHVQISSLIGRRRSIVSLKGRLISCLLWCLNSQKTHQIRNIYCINTKWNVKQKKTKPNNTSIHT